MPSNSRPTQLTETALQSTGAYELVFSAVLLGFFGYVIDRWLNTGPFFVIVLSIVGFLSATASLVYRFRYQMQLLEDERS